MNTATTPLRRKDLRRAPVEPSLSATTVVRAMPEGEWLTEAEVFLLPGVKDTLNKTGRTVKSALGEARRRGWVIRDNSGKVGTLVRTPTGQRDTAGSPK